MTFDHIHQFVLDCPIQGWEEHLNQTLALLQSFAMMKKLQKSDDYCVEKASECTKFAAKN
jgi:hypothetical protein